MPDILSIMVVEKTNTMEAKENFKGLPKCYVKMNIGQFIKQWVTPELYPELLEQTQTAQIPSLREKKRSPLLPMHILRGQVV
jgi:hypothetical protein